MKTIVIFSLLSIFTSSVIDALDPAESESCTSEANQLRDELLHSIEKTLNSQTSHHCKRKPKEKICLKAVKNLSDVEDKVEALKNLGIEGNFTRVYTDTIDLTGFSISKFYPVWWKFPDKIAGNTLNIFRHYAEDSKLNPFGDGDVHVTGLNLQIEGNDIAWGGGARYLKTKRLSQTYRKTVKSINHAMLSIVRKNGNLAIYAGYAEGSHIGCQVRNGLYLRGGLTYHVSKSFPGQIQYSTSDEETEIDKAAISDELGIKWMVKSYSENDPALGNDYDDIDLSSSGSSEITINLTGYSITKFYPVWWRFPDKIGGNTLNIFRNYAEDSRLDPFKDGDVHVAGLNLQIEGNDVVWGGGARYLKVKRLSQTYRKMVRSIEHGMLSIVRKNGNLTIYGGHNDGSLQACYTKSGLYLRGGLTYHIYKSFSQNIEYSTSDEEVEMDKAVVNSEVGIKWMVKSYDENDHTLGADLDNVDAISISTFNSVIDLTGLSINRFYPVWWNFQDQIGGNVINIFRHYAEDSRRNPFGDGDAHVAGLNLQLEGNDIPWGGGAHYIKMKLLSQTYRKTVKKIKHGMPSIARKVDDFPLYNKYNDGDVVPCMMKNGLYLRGGLTYHFSRNFKSAIGYSRIDDETEIASSIQKPWAIRWMVKSYAEDDPLLGDHYANVGLDLL